MRLFTRNGHDWSGRFPLITEAALRNRNTSFVIDGEAVLLGVDGISDFNGLHSRKHDDEVQFYAFDCLVSDGDDVRKLPLSMRKANLVPAAGAPRRRHLPERLRTGRDRPGPVPARVPDGAGGAWSRGSDRPYRAGRSPHWVKVKNRKHRAFSRVLEQFWLRAANGKASYFLSPALLKSQ